MEIGGYHELELTDGEEYYHNAIALNTGRNAFEYILRAKRYKKVYLPYYTCSVMLEPLIKLGIEIEYYKIDEYFYPLFDFTTMKKMDVFVYTNYFGICEQNVDNIVMKCKSLVIDNSQAFYSIPRKDVDTFYSPRKFFGVSDGAYVITDKKLDIVLKYDKSYSRMLHLLKRIDESASFGYDDFKRNSKKLHNQPIKKMSKITKRILSSINYKQCMKRRIENFVFLHGMLKQFNELDIIEDYRAVPLIYPFYYMDNALRDYLIREKIYVTTYWDNVFENTTPKDIEYNFASKIIPLPIDQRYNLRDMEVIVSKVKEFIKDRNGKTI